MRNTARLNKRAAELGEIVREIVQRFEGCNEAAITGPHAELTMQEMRVVEMLGESGGQMMRSVANYLGIAVNSVTTLVDNLESKGLLRRIRSDSDRRVIHVELTDTGKQASSSISDVKLKFHREMLATLTEEEQAILLVLLRKIGGLSPQDANAREHQNSSVSTTRAAAQRLARTPQG